MSRLARHRSERGLEARPDATRAARAARAGRQAAQGLRAGRDALPGSEGILGRLEARGLSRAAGNFVADAAGAAGTAGAERCAALWLRAGLDLICLCKFILRFLERFCHRTRVGNMRVSSPCCRRAISRLTKFTRILNLVRSYAAYRAAAVLTTEHILFPPLRLLYSLLSL